MYQVLTKETLRLQSTVVVFDQALCVKATEIKWKHSSQFNAIVLRMGVFHTICTFLTVIGKRFQEAGLRDACVESGVIVNGSAAGVLEGRSYNRAIRFHRIMFEALNRLAWNGFQRWIEEHHEDKKRSVDKLIKGLKQLIDSTCEPEFKDVMRSHSFEEVSQLFQSYSYHLRHSNEKLSKFFMSYVDMIEVLLGLIRATREGIWSMHLSALRGVIPWCFAYANINYARYLSAYLSEMSHLPKEHPDAFKYVSSGGFSVQLGNSNPFETVPVDQTCEETVNKDIQTSGGAKGFNLKPNAVSKYYLVAGYRVEAHSSGNLRACCISTPLLQNTTT